MREIHAYSNAQHVFLIFTRYQPLPAVTRRHLGLLTKRRTSTLFFIFQNGGTWRDLAGLGRTSLDWSRLRLTLVCGSVAASEQGEIN